jgi:hypothetical protein
LAPLGDRRQGRTLARCLGAGVFLALATSVGLWIVASPAWADPPTTTTLSASPSSSVTNQAVALSAVVTSTNSTTPSGDVSFQNGGAPIAGCAAVPLDSSGTAVCQTSFAAANSPYQLSAVFTPGASATVAGSTSDPVALAVSRDPTVTSLQVSSRSVAAGAIVTYTAKVTPQDVGPVGPTGHVAFLDGGVPIASCASRPLEENAASCSVSYPSSGTHQIVAAYSGDANFLGSDSSPPQAVTVTAGSSTGPVTPGTPPVIKMIKSTMQWTFFFSPTYAQVLALTVNDAPVGASIVGTCHGRGCAFTRHVMLVRKTKRCAASKARRCLVRTIRLTSLFRHRQLGVGAQIVIELSRPGWIGKYYRFKVRAGHAPRVKISCLAPGATRPSVGC